MERIKVLENFVLQDFRTDLTIYLDVPTEVGMARASARGALDRFEQEQNDFFERVRAVYLARAKQQPNRYCVVDASQSLERVQKDLESILNDVCKDLL